MKQYSRIFRRSFKDGWLVLSGQTPEIDERGVQRLLEIVDSHQPAVAISPAGGPSLEVENFIQDLVELLELDLLRLKGNGTGWEEQLTQIVDPGLILLTGQEQMDWPGFISDQMEPIQKSQARSSVLWLVGSAAQAIGQWVYDDVNSSCAEGLGWLPGSIILTEAVSLRAMNPVQRILREQDFSYVLNLASGGTFALGPFGEVDLWGSPHPALTLGKGWLNIA